MPNIVYFVMLISISFNTTALINALAVEGPETAMDKFQVWTEANGPKPEIEEDQTVRTQKSSAISSK